MGVCLGRSQAAFGQSSAEFGGPIASVTTQPAPQPKPSTEKRSIVQIRKIVQIRALIPPCRAQSRLIGLGDPHHQHPRVGYPQAQTDRNASHGRLLRALLPSDSGRLSGPRFACQAPPRPTPRALTPCCFSGTALQKATRLLTPFSHTPQARSTSVTPWAHKGGEEWMGGCSAPQRPTPDGLEPPSRQSVYFPHRPSQPGRPQIDPFSTPAATSRKNSEPAAATAPNLGRTLP